MHSLGSDNFTKNMQLVVVREGKFLTDYGIGYWLTMTKATDSNTYNITTTYQEYVHILLVSFQV